MRRLRVLALALLSLLPLGLGCTAAMKAQWEEVLKDARGDNMEMGSHDHKDTVTAP
jgi:hypothetical protein